MYVVGTYLRFRWSDLTLSHPKWRDMMSSGRHFLEKVSKASSIFPQEYVKLILNKACRPCNDIYDIYIVWRINIYCPIVKLWGRKQTRPH